MPDFSGICFDFKANAYTHEAQAFAVRPLSYSGLFYEVNKNIRLFIVDGQMTLRRKLAQELKDLREPVRVARRAGQSALGLQIARVKKKTAATTSSLLMSFLHQSTAHSTKDLLRLRNPNQTRRG